MLQLKTVRSFLPEKEGVAETTWNGLGLTATPIPCLPCTTGRDKVGELGLGRKEGWGEGVCKIHLYLSLLYCDSIGTGVRISTCGALLLARWANCGTCEFFCDIFFLFQPLLTLHLPVWWLWRVPGVFLYLFVSLFV